MSHDAVRQFFLLRLHTYMAKLLTDHEFQRFNELQQKQSAFTISSAEADELRDIVARAQQRRDDRAAAMQAIETHIRTFDITPEELFSPEQIAEAARAFGLIPLTKKTRKTSDTKTADAKPAATKTPDTSPADTKAPQPKPAEAKRADSQTADASTDASIDPSADASAPAATQHADAPHQPAGATLFDAASTNAATPETQSA